MLRHAENLDFMINDTKHIILQFLEQFVNALLSVPVPLQAWSIYKQNDIFA